MTQVPLAPPPQTGQPIDGWLYLLWKRLTATGQLLWSGLSFTGSNLTDIETRNHADLQNLNTASYTHLTSAQATDLTDGGSTTLHTHSSGTASAITVADAGSDTTCWPVLVGTQTGDLAPVTDSAFTWNASTNLLGIAGDLAISTTSKVLFDGVAGSGDTYIKESSSNILDFYVGGNKTLSLDDSVVLGTFSAGGSRYHGIAIQNTYASGSNIGTPFIDFFNESAAAVASFGCNINTDGSTELYFMSQPSGARTDRRTVRLQIFGNGNIAVTAGTTAMTSGFMHIPAAAGAPSGAPTNPTGNVPMYYDTTNNKLYVYNGAWKSVTLT